MVRAENIPGARPVGQYLGCRDIWAASQYKDRLSLRRSQDRLIFKMGIPILARQYLYIETAPGALELTRLVE